MKYYIKAKNVKTGKTEVMVMPVFTDRKKAEQFVEDFIKTMPIVAEAEVIREDQRGEKTMANTMNQHQKTAWTIIREEAGEIVGGRENTLLDFAEDSEEYKSAEEALADHSRLVEEIYEAVMWRGNTGSGTGKHIRFAGSDWIRERIEKVVTKWGY